MDGGHPLRATKRHHAWLKPLCVGIYVGEPNQKLGFLNGGALDGFRHPQYQENKVLPIHISEMQLKMVQGLRPAMPFEQHLRCVVTDEGVKVSTADVQLLAQRSQIFGVVAIFVVRKEC